MKINKKILSILMVTLLTGCTIDNSLSSSKGSSENVVSSNSSTKTSEVSSQSTSLTSTSTLNSSSEISNSVTSSTSSSSSEISNSVTSSTSSSSSQVISSTITTSTSSSSEIQYDEPIILDVYATNDFHGRISENSSLNEPGISKLSTYLKNKKSLNKDGYIYINSGDYWQDTYESGYNKGALLTECLDLMECETMSLGNHEFDWGVDVIRENKKLVNYTSFLGANIRNYPDTSEQVDFAEPYKIIERSGLKIGIIGAIGQYQITSITSSNWENVTFLPHTDVVKELSDELRVEKDCDVILFSIHADETDADGYEITKVSPVSNKKYVDAVFCAHSHQREIKYYNNVPFVQAGDHGINLSHIQLKYEDGVVSSLAAEYEGYRMMNNLEEDEAINKVIDKYFDEKFIESKNKVHGTIEGVSQISSAYAGNILAKATYDLLLENDIECDIVINNGSRDRVASGEMTSEKIFNMIPFTNKTLVAKNIKGEDIINECVNYTNPYYMPDSSLKIESNKYYTVACIDYMMLHKNTYRNYNYFPSYSNDKLIYTIEDYPNTIVENYLQKHSKINALDYTGANYSCLK